MSTNLDPFILNPLTEGKKFNSLTEPDLTPTDFTKDISEPKKTNPDSQSEPSHDTIDINGDGVPDIIFD